MRAWLRYHFGRRVFRVYPRTQGECLAARLFVTGRLLQ